MQQYPNHQVSINGFQEVMKKYEELKKMFAILKEAITSAEAQFDKRYGDIISGVDNMQRTEAGNLAKIAQAIGEFAQHLEKMNQ